MGTESTRTETLVIGGGVAGLAAAERLVREGHDALCLDAHDEPGGVVRTMRRDGFLLEQGPFNVLCRTAEFGELLGELSDEAPVLRVDPRAGRVRHVLTGGRLHRVPSGPLGLLRPGLVGPGGALRLARGLARSRGGEDEATLDDVVRRRFGPRIADHLFSALTMGIWGVESDELEARSTMPFLAHLDGAGRSPLRNLGAWRPRRDADAPRVRGMLSFAGGLADLTRALGERLGERFVGGAAVTHLEQGEGAWRARTVGGATFEAARVVLALGARTSAPLLRSEDVGLADELQGIDHASLTVLNLGFRTEDFRRAPEGYGFLVARTDQREKVLGVLHASTVFPNQAPEGHVSLRVFFGGTRHPELASAPKKQLVAHALEVLRRVGGLAESAVPTLVDLVRWPAAVPIYRPGHAARVERVRARAADLSGLHLIGSYLDGVSVGDCITRGVRAARSIQGS